MSLFVTAPDFDDPIGLLLACHNKILRHCETLEQLPAHLVSHGPDEEARQAAGRVLKYFCQAERLHHDDEEQNLFPLLTAHPDFPENLRAPLHNLSLQHRDLEKAWSKLSQDLEAIVAGKEVHLSPTAFIAMNRAHIILENNEIFPVALQLLSRDTLVEIGAAMRPRHVGPHT